MTETIRPDSRPAIERPGVISFMLVMALSERASVCEAGDGHRNWTVDVLPVPRSVGHPEKPVQWIMLTLCVPWRNIGLENKGSDAGQQAKIGQRVPPSQGEHPGAKTELASEIQLDRAAILPSHKARGRSDSRAGKDRLAESKSRPKTGSPDGLRQLIKKREGKECFLKQKNTGLDPEKHGLWGPWERARKPPPRMGRLGADCEGFIRSKGRHSESIRK